MNLIKRTVIRRATVYGIHLALGIPFAQGTITATYLPHGPADPPNPTWSQTAYRDIPWWFEDDNPYWADNNLSPGAADAYDIGLVYAARLNRNNASGYEASLINTPGFSHLGGSNPYGSPGGSYGTAADNVTWGNNTVWNFRMSYAWNAGSPTATFELTNGSTVHLASANLGNRIADFVNGTGPHLETHAFSDVMMRFATVGTYSATPTFTETSVTVANLQASINGAAAQPIVYLRDGTTETSLTTAWEYVAGGTAETNPRQIQFLVIDNLLPDHQSTLELTGSLSFSWTGNANNIATSGVMFETKIGDLDFFPPAAPAPPIPEPGTLLTLLPASVLLLRRTRPRRG